MGTFFYMKTSYARKFNICIPAELQKSNFLHTKTSYLVTSYSVSTVLVSHILSLLIFSLPISSLQSLH